ncbi:MAG: hypothetical protein WAO71_01215, partial [Gallionella sp.]
DVNTGRFTGLDPFAGNPSQPITLNKYAYAGGDPINGTDPSGLVTLGEQGAAMDMSASLQQAAVFAGNMLNAYNKARAIVDVILAVQQVFTFIDTMGASGGLDSILPRSYPFRVDFDLAAQVFARDSHKAIGIGLGDWIAGYIKDAPRYKSPSAYIVYLPTLTPAPSVRFNTGVKINGKPLQVGAGGPGSKTGSLTGVGLVMGKEKALYRMDIGRGNPNHVQRSSELGIFDATGGEQFSFHVYNWKDGGPR